MSGNVEIQERYILAVAVLLLLSVAVSGLYFAESEDTDMGENLMDENISDQSFVDISDRIEDNPSLRRYGLASVKVLGEIRIFVTG